MGINVFQPSLGREELDAVADVFESNWIGRGKITTQFERMFAGHLGVHSDLIRSVSSCTEGMFQSMKLFEIGAGDEVILPTISFVGAANAIVGSGAIPVFCDVDPRTLNIDVEDAASRITNKTKAILVLHYGGVPCRMDDVVSLAQKNHLLVIEDSACSVSSRYHGKPCGGIGDVGVWSFDAMKILVCGDGGMVYCRELEMIDRFEKQIYLGMTSQSGLSSKVDVKWWEFDVSCAGRRSIMNDMQSAIGIQQLIKLERFINQRRMVWDYYNTHLRGVGDLVLPPPVPDDCESSYYFYWIQTCQRDELAKYLRDRGIYTTFRYYPLHWVKFYESHESLPKAEWAALHTLCLPIHQSLSIGDLENVSDTIRGFYGMA